jgi:hypothetical protein
MHIMNPEQLSSKGFDYLLKEVEYVKRVCTVLGVEYDLHMGGHVSEIISTAGFIRARFCDNLVLIGLTVTMRKAIQTVCSTLGLCEGKFHLLCRSNLRPIRMSRCSRSLSSLIIL